MNATTPEPGRLNRRRLLQLLGAAAPFAAWLAADPGGSARAQDPEPPEPKPADPGRPPETDADEDPTVREEARRLAEVVRRRYGEHLDPQDAEKLVEDLQWNVRGGRALRAADLTNADEPDFAWRAEP